MELVAAVKQQEGSSSSRELEQGKHVHVMNTSQELST